MKMPTSDMKLFTSRYGIQATYDLCDLSFRYSCLEFEYFGTPKTGSQFYVSNIVTRNEMFKEALKRQSVFDEQLSMGTRIRNISDEKLLKIIYSLYGRKK
jgi:hypothetical protein